MTAHPRRSFPLADRPLVPATGDNRLIDLTARPRLGLRGPGTPAWCAGHGLPFPDRINQTAEAVGITVARLGTYEILVLTDGQASLPATPLPPDAWDGYRDETWFWIRMTGPSTQAALATLTSVDLRPARVPPGRVLQTRAAGLDAVLVLHEGSVDIFADIASAEYFADVLADRCPEFGWSE